MKLDIGKIKNILIYTLLFFAAMNLFAKFFYFVFAVFVVLLIFRRRIVLTGDVAVYFLLGALMAAYNAPEGFLSMLRCMAWVMFYIVGLNMSAAKDDGGERLIYDTDEAQHKGYTMLVVIASGSFAHYLLNFLYNYQNILGRNTNDIWSGSIMAATGQAALSCIMCGLAVAMLFAPPRKGCRFISATCVICLLAYNLVLACRTPIVILAFLFSIGLLYMIKMADTKKEKVRRILILLAIGLVAVLILGSGIIDLKQLLGDTNLMERFEDTPGSLRKTGRFVNKIRYLTHAWQYPFGGQHMMEQFDYAHDLWLDGYDEYGIFGLILLVAITVIGLRDLLRLLRKTRYPVAIKFTVLCVYAAILPEFCVEPILQGMAWLFACYCLINGIIRGMCMAHDKMGAEHEDPSDKHRLR